MKSLHSFLMRLRLLLPALFCVLLFAAGVCASLPDQSELARGEVWEVPLAPGDYAYHIDYLDGDLFISVMAQFVGPEGRVLAESEHTLVRGKRMRVQREFNTENVCGDSLPSLLRFTCDSGRVRVSLLPGESGQGF